MTKFYKLALEALIGDQILSDAMQRLTATEQGRLTTSVEQSLIQAHNDAIEAAERIGHRNSNNGYLHGCSCAKDIHALKIGAPE